MFAIILLYYVILLCRSSAFRFIAPPSPPAVFPHPPSRCQPPPDRILSPAQARSHSAKNAAVLRLHRTQSKDRRF